MHISFICVMTERKQKYRHERFCSSLHYSSKSLWYHQQSRYFNKRHSLHKHKRCPTSDESLPGKRISPIRGAVREREYYY
jgi:hypothetical protein